MQEVNIGTFNRPWNQFPLNKVFESVSYAGFDFIGIMRNKLQDGNMGFPIHGEISEEDIRNIKELVQTYNVPVMIHLCNIDFSSSEEEREKKLRKEIDAASQIGEKYILMCGGNTEHRQQFVSLMKNTVEYARQKNIILCLKPHGGLSATAKNCISVAKNINHLNFKIFYDPGNVLFYTGKPDSAQDLSGIIPYLEGICVKDCRLGAKPDVNISPGEGDVDFKFVFDIFFNNGFSGPCMVETLGGDSLEDITTRAIKARKYILKLINSDT